MEITFVPHIGKSGVKKKGRDVLVPFDQDQIMIDGRRAGYIKTEPGSPICLIRRYPDSIEAKIKAAVAERFGDEKKSEVHRPPKPNPEIARAEIEWDDDETEELEDRDDDDEQFDIS